MECKYEPPREKSIQERYPKIRWFEKEPNNTSAMRVFGMISMVIGSFTILSSIGLSFLTFIFERWDAIPLVTTMFLAGSGAVVSGDFAKSMQGSAESRSNSSVAIQ